MPAPPDAGYSHFMAVSAGSRTVLVVQIGGTVEGRRQQNVVRLAELENGVIQQRQVRGDDKVDLLAGPRLRGRNNRLDHRQVEKGLPALKFNLDPSRWAGEGNVQRPHRGFFAHVETRSISALAR